MPAPARQLGGWKDEAVEQMALRLVELGIEVLDERPAATATRGTRRILFSVPYESAGTDGRPPVSCASTASARSSSASTPTPWQARCFSPFRTMRVGEPEGGAERDWMNRPHPPPQAGLSRASTTILGDEVRDHARKRRPWSRPP